MIYYISYIYICTPYIYIYIYMHCYTVVQCITDICLYAQIMKNIYMYVSIWKQHMDRIA